MFVNAGLRQGVMAQSISVETEERSVFPVQPDAVDAVDAVDAPTHPDAPVDPVMDSWANAHPNSDGLITARAAAEELRHSNLSQQVLKNIWQGAKAPGTPASSNVHPRIRSPRGCVLWCYDSYSCAHDYGSCDEALQPRIRAHFTI